MKKPTYQQLTEWMKRVRGNDISIFVVISELFFLEHCQFIPNMVH